MSLDIAHEKLGWPTPEEILEPSGEGARVFAHLARAKIGTAFDSKLGRIGVLSADSKSSATQPPLAIVCESERTIPESTLHQVQKLAWNFSRAPMLVTVEPHLLRAWTCCEPPEDNLFMHPSVHEVRTLDLGGDLSQRATRALHWVNLISGRFFKEHALRFRRDQRADQTLLANLALTRQALREKGLDNDDVCHDLLARIIFIQFLFDRKDPTGNAALNVGMLERLHDDGVMGSKHQNFASVLSNYRDTYCLFAWLDDRFNGDLFPSKGASDADRERAWQAEKRQVKPAHLEVLSELVEGRLHMSTGQGYLWREYAFDAIPLEFISSIYEAFVNERARESGIYFTPPNLVDFALDQVLPWGGVDWNLKVLDPACGSGVFLVKAFQRLVNRWKNAHPEENLRAETLRSILEKNLFGVDKDPHAVRVASFSLYLAMCDEIDPKHYWTQVRFPIMRERRLVKADFFREDQDGFRTRQDARTYDFVVGNAPWGEASLTREAKNWAAEHEWPVANKGIGALFLSKAATLAKPTGKVALIQSASSLLFNRSGPACEFRKKFFTTFRVEQVVNLSALRFDLFKKKGTARKSVSPPCIVVFSPGPPGDDRIRYLSPKEIEETAEAFEIIIEPADEKTVSPLEGATDADIWTALMWGNRRDWSMIRQLRGQKSIESEVSPTDVRKGIVFGEKNRVVPALRRRRILLAASFPAESLIHLSAEHLPKLGERKIDSDDSTDFSAFSVPQLIIKKSWTKTQKRFQSRLVVPETSQGVLCTQSYVTVHVPENRVLLLEGACVSYNSILAVYFLLLTSGRFASYRPEPLVEELLRVPILESLPEQLALISKTSDFDEHVRCAFGFRDAEWVLMEDIFNVTLADFKGDVNSPGRRPTIRREAEGEEPEIARYCEYFIRVLKAGFGEEKRISATVFQENGTDLLPFRLVAIQLDGADTGSLRVERLETRELLSELETLNRTWLKSRITERGSIYHQRVARIYDHFGDTPAIFIIKPDAYRYWTRSMGLQDADDVAVDLLRWRDVASTGVGRGR